MGTHISTSSSGLFHYMFSIVSVTSESVSELPLPQVLRHSAPKQISKERGVINLGNKLREGEASNGKAVLCCLVCASRG